MKLNFDQLSTELTPLPEEKLAKVKGGYFGTYNEYFHGTFNGGSGGGGSGGGGYYYYTPGATYTTSHDGYYWNNQIGGYHPIPGYNAYYNENGTTTTSSGYWTYVPGSNGLHYNGNNAGSGGSTGSPSPTPPGVITDPNNLMQSLQDSTRQTLQQLVWANITGAIPAGRDADDFQDYYNALEATVKEIEALKNSGLDIRITTGPKPQTGFDPQTGQLVITFDNGQNGLAVNAHEIHHAYAYLQGKISFNKTTGQAGVLYDITDEMESYQRQHVLYRGLLADSYDLSGNNRSSNSDYQVSAADVIAFGNANGVPEYGQINQVATDTYSDAGVRLIQDIYEYGATTDYFVIPGR